jgi:dihydroorotate dehydrogenase
VIASGGIFSGEDAVEKFHHGAALVQVWTGFIYRGPSIVKDICASLVKHSTQRAYQPEHANSIWRE